MCSVIVSSWRFSKAASVLLCVSSAFADPELPLSEQVCEFSAASEGGGGGGGEASTVLFVCVEGDAWNCGRDSLSGLSGLMETLPVFTLPLTRNEPSTCVTPQFHRYTYPAHLQELKLNKKNNLKVFLRFP